MIRLVWAALVIVAVSSVGCRCSRQRAEPLADEIDAPGQIGRDGTAEGVKFDASSDIASSDSSEVSEVAAVPLPEVGCEAHPDLSWDEQAMHPLVSMLQTSSVPRTLAVPPGTELVLDYRLRIKTADTGVDEEGPSQQEAARTLGIEFKGVALPPTATLDADGILTWQVDRASGDTVSMAVVATATADLQRRCAFQHLVIHVVDDDERRLQQAKWSMRDTWKGRAEISVSGAHPYDPQADQAAIELVYAARQKAARELPPPMGKLVDVDGDGQLDALIDFPSAGEVEGTTWVLLRRSNEFVAIGQMESASLMRAEDGAPLLVGFSDCCCLNTMTIARVHSNRFEEVFRESGSACPSPDQPHKSEFELDRGPTGIRGFWLVLFDDNDAGKSHERYWKWDGKRFVEATTTVGSTDAG